MKFPKIWLVVLALFVPGVAQSELDAAGKKNPSGPATVDNSKTVAPYAFSFLPTAFQKRPVLAISVITELTDEGKKLRPPTQEIPYYYVSESLGFHQEGQGAYRDTQVSEENMLKTVQKALAADHYLPADKDHKVNFILYLFWGVHSRLLEADPRTDEVGIVDIKYKNLLSRAALIGGTKFARELEEALIRQAQFGRQSVATMDPVYLFSIRDDVTRSLVEQVLDDCYYVVVSAYDAAAFARGERKLLWRTKMATPSQGVSLLETSSALAASGSSYFGKDMNGPAIIGKRINRGGTVQLGELKVISMDEKDAEKSAEKAGKETPPGKK